MKIYVVVAFGNEAMSVFRSERGAMKYIREQQEILKNANFSIYETILLQ